MVRKFLGTSHENALLPEGRLSGPMPWVIAIIIFLTILAAASSLSLTQASQSISKEIAGRVTVQIVDGNSERRTTATRAVVQQLEQHPLVRAVHPVDDGEIINLMKQWLGDDASTLGLPMPALIDVDLVGPADEGSVARLDHAVKAASPVARIEPHASWLGPVSNLVSTFAWLAFVLVIMLTIAVGAVVMLTARSALTVHHGTIELLHLIGANDAQISRLFQRRLALDAGFGGLLGFLAALIVIFLVGSQVGKVGSALMSEATLGWGWLILPLIPIGLVIVAGLTARFTISSALRRIL